MLLQDVRHALRALLKQPGYLATALLTLALGIGFSTAMFSVINAVLLRPLPFAEPDRLVRLIERNLPRFPQFSVSPGHYLFWRDHNQVFSGIAAFAVQNVNLEAGGEDVQRVRADRVSANFFSLLGVSPVLGRGFEPGDENTKAPTVVMLSHGAWQRRFGGAQTVLGQTVRLDRQPLTIIGVMPASFRFPTPDVEMWVPIVFTDAERRSFGSHFMTAIARLKPGVTLEQADADMRSVSKRLIAFNPSSEGWDVMLFGLQDYLVRNVRGSLLVLLGAVLLVLLIACANVANLLLARGAARQKELAIRASIGATRFRLLRQLLVEQLLLAGASASAGILIAAWLLRALLAMIPDAMPAHVEVGLDRTVLAFAVALSVATPVLFGLLPALHASRPDLRGVMALGGRSGAGVPARRTRSLLVVAEIALAMTLLVGAGLLIRSFSNIANMSPGFEPGGALLAGVGLPSDNYATSEVREQFVGEFLSRVRSLPEVEAAGLSVPMAMVNEFNSGYRIEGEADDPNGDPITLFYAVSSGYFDVMKLPLLRGRVITDEDRRGSARVVLINQVLADRHFAGRDPIGRRMKVGQGDDAWREIVGVVGNTKQTSLAEAPRAQVYESYLQHPYFASYSIVVRSRSSDPLTVVPQLRGVLRGMDPELPLARVRTLTEVVDTTIRPERFSTALIATFGGAALLLAAVGLYGVIAYTVGLRRHEFAVRVAYGARRKHILGLVLQGAALMTLMGIGLGVAAAWILRGAIRSLLFNVSSEDPGTYVSVAAVLAATTLIASGIPALRATRVDPVEALRE